jgi:putative hydroxymethylpyrimidine transport system substrate-binding protein
MKRVLVALAAVSVSLAVAACGQKREQINPTASQGTTLMLDWFPNADHVGIYRALAQGEFKHAGLNVHVAVPPDPSAPLRLLAAG